MARLTHRVVFLVAGLVIMVALHVLVVIWALFRARPSRRVAEHADEGGGGGGGGGLSAEELGALPCHEFKEGGDGGGDGDCAVCLESFRAGDRRRVLPGCEHGFHAACVDSWLRKSRRCPVCRAEVVAQRMDAGEEPEAAAATAAVESMTGT
ncbi:hypothetical protein ACP4OV_000229 [Aristida adscensionis]